MKVVTRRYIRWSEAVGGMGSYRTSVRIESPGILMQLDLPGRSTRKEAINRAYHQLLAEGCWSPNFLRQLARTR